jgi:ATP-binding cassette, subfamily B, bacterial MsbA
VGKVKVSISLMHLSKGINIVGCKLPFALYICVLKKIAPILQFLNGKWPSLLLFAFYNLLSVVFSMISLVMLIPFLNVLFGKTPLLMANPGFYFTKQGISDYYNYQMSALVAAHQNDKMYVVIIICVGVLSAIILKNVFLYLSRYTMHPLRNSIITKMRKDVFEKIMNLPISFFSHERKGDVMARMTNDVAAVEDSIMSVMDLLLSSPFTIIFYLLVLISLSWKLFLFLVIFLPIAGWIIGRVSKNLKSQSTNNSIRIGNLLSILEETIGGLRIVKGFGAEALQMKKFTAENEYLNNLNNQIARRRELASPLSETLGIAVMCVVLWFGSKLVFNTNEISSDVLIAFILVFTQLIDPLKKFSQIFYNIDRGSASLDRLNQILLATNVVAEKENALPLAQFQHSIELQNVSFSYGDVQILNNINLQIVKGTTVALVGASGSGKSTLVDLIPRFHDASQGKVMIDGVDITDYKISDVRALMGIVSQEAILFNDSIKNNIALSMQDADDASIVAAAKIANAHQFVEGKEDAYETNIGDRGNKLSGGEKQRVTIARAILKNPPILILDEATSSLDTTSEKIVQEAINNVMAQRTCIIIAHRLSTIKSADKIVVLDKGRIAEQGTHDQLLALNGIYKELVSLQQLK